MKNKKIYIRILTTKSLRLYQVILFNIVLSLNKASALYGGDRKWHIGIKYRKATDL